MFCDQHGSCNNTSVPKPFAYLFYLPNIQCIPQFKSVWVRVVNG